MLRGDNIRCYRVHGIPTQVRNMACASLQGEVYSWCANHDRNGWFAARNFAGGINREWEGTTLYPLFEFYENKQRGRIYAKRQAGIALGHLLKYVLSEDKRTFETRVIGRVRQYRWLSEIQPLTREPAWLR